MKSLFKEYGTVILALMGMILFLLVVSFFFPTLRNFVSQFIQTLTGSGNTV